MINTTLALSRQHRAALYVEMSKATTRAELIAAEERHRKFLMPGDAMEDSRAYAQCLVEVDALQKGVA